MKRRYTQLLGAVALVAGFTATALADPGDVFYVDRNNESGAEDGLSWATAFTAIQDGIETARTSFGGEVWVARGVYDETRPNAGSLRLRPNVALFGGFTGGEAAREQRDPLFNVTVIEGAFANEGLPTETVVVGANNTTIDGFTIRGGVGRAGAGMLNLAVAPQIIDCIFSTNQADLFGGAMFNGDGASPQVIDCVFTNNAAGESGGAVANTGANPTFRGCLFSINVAVQAGGAIFNTQGGDIIVSGSTFEKNEAANGAAIFNEGARPSIDTSEFRDNFTPGFGAAVFNNNGADALLVNCLIAANEAAQGGAAISSLDSTVTIVNCTIADNLCPVPGSVFFNNNAITNVLNTVIWYNSTTPFFNLESFTEIRWSNVGGGDGGPNNIAIEPRFTDRLGGDYTLLADSPNIDAGSPNGAPAVDILGVARPQGDGVDMGAYEVEDGTPPPPPPGMDCRGTVGMLQGSSAGDLTALLALVLTLGLSGRAPRFRTKPHLAQGR